MLEDWTASSNLPISPKYCPGFQAFSWAINCPARGFQEKGFEYQLRQLHKLYILYVSCCTRSSLHTYFSVPTLDFQEQGVIRDLLEVVETPRWWNSREGVEDGQVWMNSTGNSPGFGLKLRWVNDKI